VDTLIYERKSSNKAYEITRNESERWWRQCHLKWVAKLVFALIKDIETVKLLSKLISG